MTHPILSRRSLLALGASAALLVACGTSVERMDAKTTVDLSGEWNDVDSRQVSDEMIADVMGRPWISDHLAMKQKKPAVVIGSVRNLSHEHINTKTFVNDLERALINSGRVIFVASKEERSDIRDERKDQELNATETTRKAMGQELGADYQLQGSINTIYDTEGSKQVRFYQVDLTLISLSDNTKVWIGQKKIKKLVKNASVRS